MRGVGCGDGGMRGRRGWAGREKLTFLQVRAVDEYWRDRGGVCFMLWGAFARRKRYLLRQSASNDDNENEGAHLILEAPHPSPLAGPGFSGCRHFSICDAWLQVSRHPIYNSASLTIHL